MLKRLMIAGVCVGLSAWATACRHTVPDSELVAKVNGEGITKADFEKEVERNMKRYQGPGHTLPPGIEQRIKQSVLRRMIDEKVTEQKAKELAVTVTPAELDAKFQEHKSRFRTEQAFQDYLKRANNSVENMKNDLRSNLLRDRVVEKLSGAIEVTDEDIQKYYDENSKRFVEKERVRASRVLVRVPHDAAPDVKAKANKQAAAILAKIKAGGDFAAIAKESSNGPEASRGGDLGWMTRGRMPPAFDEAAFSMEKGQLSDVVETKLGFEIIKIDDKKVERQRPFDEVKENIKNSLIARKRNQKRREVLRSLKKEAKVEQLIEFERPEPMRPGAGPHGAPGPHGPGMKGMPHRAPGAGPFRPPMGRMPGKPMPPSHTAGGTQPAPANTQPAPAPKTPAR